MVYDDPDGSLPDEPDPIVDDDFILDEDDFDDDGDYIADEEDFFTPEDEDNDEDYVAGDPPTGDDYPRVEFHPDPGGPSN